VSFARVHAQSASRYPLGELLRVLRGRVRVVLSVVEPYFCHDFAEPERPRLPQAQDTMQLPDVAILRVLPLPHLFQIILPEAGIYVLGVPIHLDIEEGPVYAR
jgi:hypothetical protein